MPVEVRTTQPEPDSLAERRRVWLDRSRLYLVCDAHPGGREPEEVLRPALQAGVDIVQLREKPADGPPGRGAAEPTETTIEAGHVFRRLCDAYDALFIVNDSPELAIACSADGVHIGQDDADAREVRRALGHEALIGLSTHSPAEVDRAEGVDYVSVGPVHRTPTKPQYEPVGLDLVRYAAEHTTVPFFAIGGIDPTNVDEVLDAGAGRVAVVRAIRDALDPAEAARLLRARVYARASAGSTG